MLLVAAALFDNDPQAGTVSIAVNLLIFFSALLMVKTVLDVARVLNENFGLDTVFGDNDGFSAVRIRTKTSHELSLVEHEVEELFARPNGNAGSGGGRPRGANANQQPLLEPIDLDESDESAESVSQRWRGNEYQHSHLAASTIMGHEDDDELADLIVDYDNHGSSGLTRGRLADRRQEAAEFDYYGDDNELAQIFDDENDFNEFVELGMQIEAGRAHSSVVSDDQPQEDATFDPTARVQLLPSRRRY